MMMNILHLTPAEQTLFDSLSEEVKEGWEVAEETLTVEDVPEKRAVRMQLLRLQDPKMKEFQEAAIQTASMEELAALINDTDLSELSDHDLSELFFAMGPDPLNVLIPLLLQSVTLDDDLESIVALTTIRNSLLVSMQPA